MDEIIEISVNNSEHKIVIDAEMFDKVKEHTWWLNDTGYAVTKITTEEGRKEIKMHRLLMDFPDGIVDHVNRVRHDNRISNLRVTSPSGNAWNKRKVHSSPHRFKGLGIEKRGKKWRYKARLAVYNERISLGAYATDVEAAKAYNVAAEFFQGEYALLNEVDHSGFVIDISGPAVVSEKILSNDMYRRLYDAGLLKINGIMKEVA